MQRRQVISSAGLGLLALAVEGGEAALADQAVITFLHFNDVYEISPQDGIGGFAEFMTLLGRERARNPNTITTFGGDLLSPSVMSGLTRGRQMIELADALGVQVAVAGNHEYDFGPELAEERIRAAGFPWLGTNVLGPDGTPASGLVDLQLITVAGYKIGFFGVLTPATATLSQPGPAISFASPQAVAEAATRQLREMGADLVVALTHLDAADDRALAAFVADIDLVLGGHDHEPMSFFEHDKLIVKAGFDLHYLIVVDLVVGRLKHGSGRDVVWVPSWRYETTAQVPAEPRVQQIVDRWNRTLDAQLAVPVAETLVALDTRYQSLRTGETNFGDLVADALRSATGADVALTNSGSIRGDRLYPAGTVLTYGDILRELPFGNVVVVVEVTGADLLAALDHGVSQIQDLGPAFPRSPACGWCSSPPASTARGSTASRSPARRWSSRPPTASPPPTICAAAATAMPA